jgi:hypothetical protein
LLELHAKAERFQSIGDAAVTRVNFRLKESRELTAINGSPAPAWWRGCQSHDRRRTPNTAAQLPYFLIC